MSKLLSPTREERLQAALSGTAPPPGPAGDAARAKPPTTAPRAETALQPPAARKP
jgi:hypothetical protein